MMKDRLREIIQYKTFGKQKQFAEFVGWKPQYLARLLGSGNFGLQPVLTLLKALPEINARWLLLGEGTMLMDDCVSDLRRGAFNHIQAVLDLERFVPVMTPDELSKYERMITAHNTPDFSAEERQRWIEELHEIEQERETRLRDATKQSDELCRQKTAKE